MRVERRNLEATLSKRKRERNVSKKGIRNALFGMQNVVEILHGLILAMVVPMVGIQLTNWKATLLGLAKSPVSAMTMPIILAVAMAGVGLRTDIGKLRQIGAKHFYVGLFAALSVGVVSVVLIKIIAPLLATVR